MGAPTRARLLYKEGPLFGWATGMPIPDLVKVGAFVVLIGFLTIGSASLYLATAPLPNTPEDAVRAQEITKNAVVAQGLAWIAVGLGLATAFLGLVRSDFAMDSKLEMMLVRLPSSGGAAKTGFGFTCSECGGELSESAKVCPHCGSPIED